MDYAGLADAYLIGMSEGPNFDAAMERRFQEYVEDLGTVVGNDARRSGLSDYMTELLLPGERKSMEPIAERLESGNISRRHQSIQHFVSEASAQCAALCQTDRVHSAYQRRLADLPWQGRDRRDPCAVSAVLLSRSLTVPAPIFTERLPEVVRPKGRRTLRMACRLSWVHGPCPGR